MGKPASFRGAGLHSTGPLQSLQKLAGLLHDGQIRGKVRVKYIVETDLSGGGHHLAHGSLLPAQSQLLAPGGPHRRCNLSDHNLLRIHDRPHNLLRVVALPQRAGGTVGNALAADGTVGLADRQISRGVDPGALSGVDDVPHIHGLHLITNLHTAHALDTFPAIADQRERAIPVEGLHLRRERHLNDVQLPGQFLQRTVLVAHAGGAAIIVLGENELHIHPSGVLHPGTVGGNAHSLLHHVVAGSHQPVFALNLHQADTAGADLVDFFQETESGNPVSGLLGSLQNGRSSLLP